MSEVFFSGPAGKIHGSYSQSNTINAPVAIVMHPHPLQGGTMNNKVSYRLYKIFQELGFSTLRFNFRGCGKSDGEYCGEGGEVADAAAAFDWLQYMNPNVKDFWVSGFSFGSYVAMQLLMRRPEIKGFVCVAPPANLYDFSFLAPCPRSGLMLCAEMDTITPLDDVATLVKKLNSQKNICVEHTIIPGSVHSFENSLVELTSIVKDYVIENAFANISIKKTA